jgi:hypothetical protein
MMTAAERLAAIDAMPAAELCRRTMATLESFISIVNEETTLLRAGRVKEASLLSAEKTALAQDYMGLVRSVQRQGERLRAEAPDEVELLRSRHDRLATQLAENLKVLATAREITEEVLTDVANTVGRNTRARTYAATGRLGEASETSANGIAINRAL